MTVNFETGIWLNEPMTWSRDGNRVSLVTDAKTDFWRNTYYGFVRDSGHFLGYEAGSSFTATVRVTGKFESLYDQAGLMIRIDDTRWVKTGVELTDGELFLSTVVTNGNSDWSVAKPFDELDDFYLRVTVKDGAMRIQASRTGTHWPLARLAPFPVSERYLVGPMACTPERAGLSVVFSDFTIGPALTTDLHDLS
jgi:regulation of enolase protein 1 (concanavalin A-like superfamily)